MAGGATHTYLGRVHGYFLQSVTTWQLALELNLNFELALQGWFQAQLDRTGFNPFKAHSSGQIYFQSARSKLHDTLSRSSIGNVHGAGEVTRINQIEVALCTGQSQVDLGKRIIADLHVVRQLKVKLHATKVPSDRGALAGHGKPQPQRDC